MNRETIAVLPRFGTMKNYTRMLAILLPAMALAACGADPDGGEQTTPAQTEDMAMPVEPDGGIGDGASAPDGMAAATIPAALYGRWGINPGDCTDERGDAKGSIQISAEGLRFYESRATVREVANADDASIRATYDFLGEGQSWSRDIELRMSADGTKLVQTEFGEGAITQPMTYTKCPA